MDKVLVGKIPEKIIYVCRAPHYVPIGSEFDYVDMKDGSKKFQTILATPSFIVEHDNPKTIITAEKWANYYNNTHCKSVTVENKAIKKVRITSLEKRYQDSSTYKCIVDDTYYVDLKEDILLETVLNCGITNGYLNSEFVWATGRGGMYLVRVGSERYKSIINYDSLSKRVPDPLEIGYVYSDKNLDKYLYLGKYNSINYTVPIRNAFGDPKETVSSKVKGHFFRTLSNNEKNNVDLFNINSPLMYDFDFKQKFPGIIKLYKVDIPETFFSDLKDILLNKTFENEKNKYDFLNNKNLYSKYINMVPDTEKPVDLIKKRLSLNIFK